MSNSTIPFNATVHVLLANIFNTFERLAKLSLKNLSYAKATATHREEYGRS
jgi:hypothetical protein